MATALQLTTEPHLLLKSPSLKHLCNFFGINAARQQRDTKSPHEYNNLEVHFQVKTCLYSALIQANSLLVS